VRAVTVETGLTDNLNFKINLRVTTNSAGRDQLQQRDRFKKCLQVSLNSLVEKANLTMGCNLKKQ